MKKMIIVLAAAAVVVPAFFYLRSCSRLMTFSAEVHDEARGIYDEFGRAVAYKALEITRPYMDELRQGKYEGRLEQIPRIIHGFLSITDSYEKIIFDMGEEFRHWVNVQSQFTLSENAVYEKLGETPRGKVYQMGKLLQDVHILKFDDFKSVEEVKVAKGKLAEAKQRLRELSK